MRLFLALSAVLVLFGGVAAARAQADWTDLSFLIGEEQRICELAADPNTTLDELANAQAAADTILLQANAFLLEAELNRLHLGASLLVAAANAFVESKSDGVELARIALGGTTYTLATVVALKSGEVEAALAVLASGDIVTEQFDSASGLAVELYVAVSLHGTTLASAAGVTTGEESLFPGLNEIFLFKSDVPSLLAAAPAISALIFQLGEQVTDTITRNNDNRLLDLAVLEENGLPSRRAVLSEVEEFHQRVSICIVPSVN